MGTSLSKCRLGVPLGSVLVCLACGEPEVVRPPPVKTERCELPTDGDPWRPIQIRTDAWDGVMVRLANGRLVCWGPSAACPTEEIARRPVLLDNVDCSTWTSISKVGGVSVTPDGAVLMWTYFGFPLKSTANPNAAPWEVQPVLGLPPIVRVEDGGGSLWALDREGTAWYWGDVYAWSIQPDQPGSAPDLGQFQTIWGGGNVCGLRLDGSVSCFGGNGAGQLGDGTLTPREEAEPALVPPARALWTHALGSCAATLDEELWCWGTPEIAGRGREVTQEESATPAPVVGLPPVKTVSIGVWTACAVTLENDLYCWGANPYRKFGFESPGFLVTPRLIEPAGKVEEVAVAFNYICIIRMNGSVWCGGLPSYTRPGDDWYRWDQVDLSDVLPAD